jgi:hypothetical protein
VVQKHNYFPYALVSLAVCCVDLEFSVWVVLTFLADRGYSAVQYGRRVLQMVQLNVGLVCNKNFVSCTTHQ